MSKRFIVGAAFGYTWAQVERFVTSALAHGGDATVVLAVDGGGALSRHFSEHPQAEIQLIEYQEGRLRRHLFPRLPKPLRVMLAYGLVSRTAKRTQNVSRRLRWLCRNLVSNKFLRHFVISDWIHRHPAVEDSIWLLCDTRDLVFQSNPFVGEICGKVICAAESQLMNQSVFNVLAYLKFARDPNSLGECWQQPATCNGLILAPKAAIQRYLEAMIQVIAESSHRCVGGTGGDQGAHNCLVNERWPSMFQVLTNQNELVAHLGDLPSNVISHNPDGLYSVNGVTPAILHQWDKHALFNDWYRPST